MLATARGHLQRQEAAAAVLQLKSLLQVHPQSGEARLLLGQTYADLGSPLEAEAEYRRAMDAGMDPLRVAPLLAGVLLEQRRAADAIKELATLDGPDKAALAALKAQLALAYLVERHLDRAQAAVDQSLALEPARAPARIAQARLQAARGESSAAQVAAIEITQRWPDDAQGWVLKGDLAAAAGAPEQATVDYLQALQRRPDLALTHIALISLHLAGGDVDAAQRQWVAMDKVLPALPKDGLRMGNPLTLYAAAVLAMRKGDALRTRELTGILLRNNPNQVRILVLAGQAEMQLQSWRMAQNLLWRAIVASAKTPEPRRLAAQAHLAVGQADRAWDALEPLVLKDSTDRQALMLAAQARQMAGDQRAARELFSRASALMPDDPKVRTALAVAGLSASGERAVGAELQAIAESDQGTTADLALFNLLLERRDWGGAARALDRLTSKQPTQPLPALLRGQLAAQQKDATAARRHWQQALTLAPAYFPAADSLAGLEAAAGRYGEAAAYYEALLKADPDSARAWMMLAAMKVKGGAAPASVTSLLERAVKADPIDPAPRVALIDHLTALGDRRQAVTVAQAAIAVLPDAPEILDSQARLYMANGSPEQALANFTRLAAMSPRSAKAYLQMADAQIASGKVTSANDSVRRAIDLEPDALPVQRAAIALAMREQKPAQALVVAQKVQRQRPQDATGFLFEGDIAASQQQWSAAEAAYRAALTRPNPGTAAMRLHLTLINAGQPAQAEQFALGWVKAHPGDVDLRFQLGDVAHLRGDWPGAELHYRAVLAQRPEHAMAMNNLADTLLRQRKPGAAALAEQAAKRLPKDPRPLDTWASALAAERRFDRALELQAQALSLSGDQPLYRLNLAKLQLMAGDKAAARGHLARLADLGEGFVGHREVASLLATAAK